VTAPGLTTRSEQRAFDGLQGFYEHESTACGGPMRFSVYLPPAAARGAEVPALYFLAGLTCTEETFMMKAGAQRVAAALGLALVRCDTSPRAARFPGDDAAWDFGQGAGFYLDASEAPWSAAYSAGTFGSGMGLRRVLARSAVRPSALAGSPIERLPASLATRSHTCIGPDARFCQAKYGTAVSARWRLIGAAATWNGR
jgi:hypothetical protein